MPALDHFAADYGDARSKFLEACARADLDVTSYRNPAPGPEGTELYTDVVQIGPRDASKSLVTCSSTHGIEGFFGSACQVGWLNDGHYRALPGDMSAVLIHAINPYGFAWQRRVNEDNVDINRNFIDHTNPPINALYGEVADALLPRDWTAEAVEGIEAAIAGFIERRGDAAYRAAVVGGQYAYPEGLFYGGDRPCWSNHTLTKIAEATLSDARDVAMIDFHTGLGPYAYAELICRHAPGSAALARARNWYGDAVTSPQSGESESPPIEGNVRMAFVDLLPEANVTAVAIEIGTLPSDEVLMSLIADNWLHLRGDVNSNLGREIKGMIRAAFFPDKPDWNVPVFERSMEIVGEAIQGLARS